MSKLPNTLRDKSGNLIKKGHEMLNKDLERNNRDLDWSTRYYMLKELDRYNKNRLAWYGVFIPDILGLFDSIDELSKNDKYLI